MAETFGCERCNQTGFIRDSTDETNFIQCVCSYMRLLKKHMGAEIASADVLDKSPLYGGPSSDKTRENIWLRSEWIDVLPHLKFVLAHKGFMFRYRIVTDERIKSVFVGAESYVARTKAQKDEPAFNTLSDLVGGDIPLVLIRLGFLGHKNIAGPGSLKEALMIREATSSATWLIEAPSAPYSGCHSWSAEVESYMRKRFDPIELGFEPQEGVQKKDDKQPAPISVPLPVMRAFEPFVDVEKPTTTTTRNRNEKKKGPLG